MRKAPEAKASMIAECGFRFQALQCEPTSSTGVQPTICCVNWLISLDRAVMTSAVCLEDLTRGQAIASDFIA